MAVKIAHYTLTLSGVAQPLSDALPAVTGTLRPGAYDYPCTFLSLQPDGGNGAVIYLGADNTVSAANHGVRLEAGTAGAPPAPFILEIPSGNVKVGDLWVLGTAGEELHLFLISA